MILDRFWYNSITMSIIPLPERGQPLDVTYIYQLASAVNQLATNSPNTQKRVHLSVPNGGTENKNILDLRVLASSVTIGKQTTTAGEEFSFPIPFAFEFKYPPIITATPVNIRNTAAGKDVTVVLNDITPSSAQGTVRFGTSGDLSVAVHLIIVGIPNQ